MNNKSAFLSLPVLSAVIMVPAAVADVTIEQRLTVDAAGALSMAAMHGTTVTSVSGSKSRTENDLEFESRLMRTFAGRVGKTVDIVRLDEDRVMNLDYKKKRYSETTFAEMRAQTEQALQQMEDMQSSQEPGQPGGTALPVTEQNCEWSDAVVDAKKTGAQQKFAGLSAEQTVITATQTCVDPETSKACDMTWTLDQWLAPDAPGGEEVQAFWQGYAQKLGLEQISGRPDMPGLAQIFSQYQQGWEDIEKKTGDLNGYPVKVTMQLEIGGEQCTTPGGQPISNQSVFGEGMSNAAGGAAAEGIGGAAGGAIGGAIAKGLFKSFGKKKKAAEESAPVEPVVSSVRLFRVETETTNIGTTPVSADRFEVPAGFSLSN